MPIGASVIVPARDAAAHLPAALAGLAAQRRPPHEVIVVDDGSRDATAQIAAAHEAVGAVVAGAGEGPGAARNAGAARASGDVLAFTDADCVAQPGWLEHALEAFERGAELVQGAVVPDPAARRGPWDRTISVTAAHGLFETANLLVRRDLFERLGGFERWLSPRRGKELGEDVWLGWRATRAGARVEFCAAAVVHHAVIPRGPAAFVAERVRLRHFPALAARIPELRDVLLHRRVFLSRRSAAFDAAAVGAAVALAGRRPAALALCAPYARVLWRDGAARAPVALAADAVGAAALLAGSVAHRSPVL